MTTIQSNAVLSITLAAEDYQSQDPRRTISAMRNITAGILLLFKTKLQALSPADSHEVLIKSSVVPRLRDGQLVFVGDGSKTVDKSKIERRFRSLDIKADWKRTDELIRLRNNIEHYRADATPSVMREVARHSS